MKNQAKVDEIILLTIRKIGINGEGIGYYKKQAVFVNNTIVGDIVEVKITKVKRGYLEAEVKKYKKKSNNYVKPFCAFYEKCGGCNMMHMNYDTQLNSKKVIVEEAFTRYMDDNQNIKVSEIIGMKDPYFYRNKAQLPVWFEEGKTKYGLYEQKTNKLVFIDHCKVQHKFLNRVVEFVAKEIDKLKIKVYNRKSLEGCIRYIVPRIGNVENKLQVTIVYYKYDKNLEVLCDRLIKDPNISSVYISENNKDTHEIMPGVAKFMAGKKRIDIKIGDSEFSVQPKSFFQLNTLQTEKLYKEIRKIAYSKGPQIILDAFCGAGTIGQFIAKKDDKLIGIDLNASSIQDAELNAEKNGIENAKYYEGKVEEVYPMLVKRGLKADTVIVDPPRTGLHKDFIKLLKERRITRFIYISCNPSTLAKDANILKSVYKIKKVKCFDMFPHTSQVESIALFESIK